MISRDFKKAFITEDLRPVVSGQYYDPNPSENYLEILRDISAEDIKNTRNRRQIIIRLLKAKFSIEDIEYKLLLKDIFHRLLARLESDDR